MSLKFQISQLSWILIFSCASMFALGLGDNIRGPLFADLITHFDLTNTQASFSFAITSTFGFIGNLISSIVLRRISLSQLLSHALLLMALGLFLMGLTNTFNLYLLSAALFGLGMGLLGVAQNLLVAENFHGVRQAQALSGLHGLYGLSSLIAPFVAAYGPHFFGYARSAFYITAAISVIVYLTAVSFKPKGPIVHVVRDGIKAASDVSRYALFIFGGILAFYVVAEILISTRIALYMREIFHFNLEASSLYVTYFFVFLLIGRVLFALKKFQFKLKSQLNFLMIFSFLFLLAGLVVHPFFLALTGLAMAPYYPLAMAYLSELTQEHKRKIITFAMGLQNFALIIMHVGVGFLTDKFGLLNAFGVGLIAILLTLICVNFHPRVLT